MLLEKTKIMNRRNTTTNYDLYLGDINDDKIEELQKQLREWHILIDDVDDELDCYLTYTYKKGHSHYFSVSLGNYEPPEPDETEFTLWIEISGKMAFDLTDYLTKYGNSKVEEYIYDIENE